jgi:hypothetical protein
MKKPGAMPVLELNASGRRLFGGRSGSLSLPMKATRLSLGLGGCSTSVAAGADDVGSSSAAEELATPLEEPDIEDAETKAVVIRGGVARGSAFMVAEPTSDGFRTRLAGSWTHGQLG